MYAKGGDTAEVLVSVTARMVHHYHELPLVKQEK